MSPANQACIGPKRPPTTPKCPPADAVDGPMKLFRLAASEVPTAADCLTAEECNTFLNKAPCQRKSLSGYSDWKGADQVRRRVKHFNSHHICSGIVPAGGGGHQATPTKHGKADMSWGAAPNSAGHLYFS